MALIINTCKPRATCIYFLRPRLSLSICLQLRRVVQWCGTHHTQIPGSSKGDFCQRNYSSFPSAQYNKVMELRSVIEKLDKLFPCNLAESWDNVGLLIEPSPPCFIRNVMLTNDLTECVLQEAVEKKINLIISYHPPIFQSFKTLKQSVVKQRIVIGCLENRIAVYSPHTSSDNVVGGVNDWLITGLGPIKWKRPIQRKEDGNNDDHADATDETPGSGRICQLGTTLSLSEVISRIKAHLDIANVRLAVAENQQHHDMKDVSINRLCVCAGSGGSVLRDISDTLPTGAASEGVLLWTGEMSHHDTLHATAHGHHVLLCEHSNTERPYLRHHLTHLLRQQLVPPGAADGINIMLAATDREPLQVV